MAAKRCRQVVRQLPDFFASACHMLGILQDRLQPPHCTAKTGACTRDAQTCHSCACTALQRMVLMQLRARQQCTSTFGGAGIRAAT